MAGEILVTSKLISTKMEELKSLNENFKTKLDEMTGRKVQLLKTWEGTAAEAFGVRYDAEYQKMLELYNTVVTFHNGLGEICERYAKAEQKTMQIAQKHS